MKEVFEGICAAPATVAAVEELNQFELAELIVWLRAENRRGISGLVLGLCEVEAAERFLKAHLK